MFTKQRKYLTAKLLTYFIEHPIIFLGYSVSDSNIKNILSDIFDMTCINCEDEIVDNIWFIDWQNEKIDSNLMPTTEKVINVGDNRNIRVNYILLNEYVELFKTLYQGTYMDINDLQSLQDIVYNIVKSKTISNLEVDVINVKEAVSEKSILNALKLDGMINNENIETNDENRKIINFGVITDPEQILTRYPFRITTLAVKLGFSHWVHVKKLMNGISEKSKFNFIQSNNEYHVDVGVGKGSDHRYSMEMYKLLKNFKENKNAPLEVKGNIIEVRMDEEIKLI